MSRFLVFVSLLAGAAVVRPAPAATLAPSADPATAFIVVADSLARTGGDAALASFVRDNDPMVGSAVAQLLDVAFQVAQQGDTADEKDNVTLARKVAAAHEAAGGSTVVSSLIDAYAKWTPAQRKLRAQAMKLESDAVAARKSGDIPRAVDLLGQARAIYERIGDKHAVAVNWGSMGVAQWGTGDWNAVIQDYEKALAARRAVEDRVLEGRTLNGLGSAYQQKNDWDKSEDYYRQAIELRTKIGDLAGLGTSLTYLGHDYNYAGRYVEARDQYEKALPILQQLGDPRQMVELLTGIALVDASMGRMEDANDAYRRGIGLSAQNKLGADELLCRRNLADNFRLQGRFTEALDELDAAQRLLKDNPDADQELLIHQTRGLTYMDMGELDQARVDLLRAAELAKASENPSHLINAQTNIGLLYREMGAYDRAIQAAEQARDLAERAGNGPLYRYAVALRAESEHRLGRNDDALASWREVLAQDQNDDATTLIMTDNVAIASIEAELGATEDARKLLRLLMPRVRADRLSTLEWSILLTMGHTFEKENPDSAAYYYDAALAKIDQAGEHIGGSEIQSGFLSGQRRYYYEEVARFYAGVYRRTRDARWNERAFHTMEQAKARGLLDLLKQSVAGQPTPEENRVLDALYTLDPRSSDYATRHADLEQRYVGLRDARVRSAMGGLASAGATVSLADLARMVPKKTVVLEYALGDSASIMWVTDRDGSDLVMLPPRSKLDTDVRLLRDAIKNVDGGGATLLKTARSLYTMLVAPAGRRFEEAETVIVIPDGVLFELPFEVLLSRDPAPEGDWKNQPYLAKLHTFVYAPSATVYASLRQRPEKQKYARELLAVGNPDFTTLTPVEGDAPLRPLPFAAQEVSAIAGHVKAAREVVLTGGAATEAAVKKELRTDAPRIVHLATHGLIDAIEPARSSVALAAGGGDDGYLHTLEILATPIHSDLVVMSACESAGGRVSRGEGVVGLSRAFLAAGVQSVVASLWSVSDESTEDLMKTFYDKMLDKKHSAARALNEARLAMIDGGKFAHPFYWSPFIVTGTETSPW